MKLKTLEQVVLETLTEQPETQKDDFILILKVYEKLTDKDTMGQSFSVLMTYHNDFGLPPFESVRRCRQKVQAKHSELVDPSTAKHRHKLIDEYKEYAKDKEVIGTHKVGDKAKVIANGSEGIYHYFKIGSIVTFDGFSDFGNPKFAGEKFSQALSQGDFEWLDDPKPKQAKLIRDNGYFFKVGETIGLIEKNDVMGLFSNGFNTCWVYLTDIEWIGE